MLISIIDAPVTASYPTGDSSWLKRVADVQYAGALGQHKKIPPRRLCQRWLQHKHEARDHPCVGRGDNIYLQRQTEIVPPNVASSSPLPTAARSSDRSHGCPPYVDAACHLLVGGVLVKVYARMSVLQGNMPNAASAWRRAVGQGLNACVKVSRRPQAYCGNALPWSTHRRGKKRSRGSMGSG